MRRDLLEDESNPERWLISYADFITLLFAFFVVMYAISSVNDEKYRVLSNTLSQAFDVDANSPDPIQVGQPLRAASPHVVDVPETEGWADDQFGDTFIQNVADKESPLGGFAASEGVSVEVNNEWVEVSLNSEFLFAQGQATLSRNAASQLEPLVSLLLASDNPVTIEGYTDNIPPGGGRYPSNWDLSGARASAVAQFLSAAGVRQHRIAAIGYGENHPLQTNATPEGRAANRRVAVVIARRSSLARNRNAATAEQTKAVVTPLRATVAAPVTMKRKEDGGLIFTEQNQEVPPTDEGSE